MLSIEPGPPPFSPHLCIITQNEEEISIHSTCPWNICKYSSRRFVQFDDQESCTKRLNDRAYVLYEFSCDGFHERMKQITVTVGRSVSPSTSKRQQASNSGDLSQNGVELFFVFCFQSPSTCVCFTQFHDHARITCIHHGFCVCHVTHHTATTA